MPQEELTHLSVYEWARIIGINPLHVMGVQIAELDQQCNGAWYRWNWQQAGKLSREDVVTAIAQAESDIENALGFRLFPTWEVDEWQPMPQPSNPRYFNLSGAESRGFRLGTTARWGHFVSGGIRSQELVAADAAIVYSNTRPPVGYDNLATVTVATEALDPAEIAVYYPDHAGDEHWRIRPVHTVIANGTATITFQREQAVIEDREDAMQFAADLRPTPGREDDQFLTAVDVYRVYNDPQQQAQLVWEPQANWCGELEPSAYTVQPASIHLTGDPRLSMLRFAPGTWDPDAFRYTGASLTVGRSPDLVRIYYLAGLRDRTQRTPLVTMSPEWARTVAYYATALLDCTPCACFESTYKQWRLDLGDPGPKGRQLSDVDMASPFGLRQGAIHAWRRVLRGRPIGRNA